MARSLPVENLLPQNVGSIINQLIIDPTTSYGQPAINQLTSSPMGIDHNQLRTIASETVDLVDWLHPPPSQAVPPEPHVHSVAGAIAGEITSVIYLRFVLANRIYVEVQRILLCGKSKNSHFYYFNKLKQERVKMTLKNKP